MNMHIQCDEYLINQFVKVPLSRYDDMSSRRHASILGDWYAGIIKILGSEFLIFVHTKTLYSTMDFLDFASNPQMDQSLINLRGKILEMLDEEYYLTDSQINHLIRPFQEVTFGYMRNKRMVRIIQGIGLAYHKRFLQARQRSSAGEVRLWELEEEDLNNTARRNLGGSTPLATLLELIRSGVN